MSYDIFFFRFEVLSNIFFRFQLHNSNHPRSNLKSKRKYKYNFLKLKTQQKKKKHSKRIDSLWSSNARRIDSQWHQI